jgi:6-pyruvoyltetrahydropterin/6-carboxytetrahydropterin synthase
MYPVITRRLEFDAGHRVLGHGGKCKHLHGHRYVAEISVKAKELDKLGMVIDFSVVKELVGGWIDTHWDHNMILHPDDPLMEALVESEAKGIENLQNIHRKVFGGKEPYTMSGAYKLDAKFANPTAENMARELFNVADILLSKVGVEVVRVRLYETPNCWADYPCSR